MSITEITTADLDVARVDTDEFEVRTEIGTFYIRKVNGWWDLEMDEELTDEAGEQTVALGKFPTLLTAKGHIAAMINADRELVADMAEEIEPAADSSVEPTLPEGMTIAEYVLAEGARRDAEKIAKFTAEPMQPAVHTFDSTGEAYNASQWRDDINDGDILFVPSERVIGFLYAAWPMAVTEEHGMFHGTTTTWDELDGGIYLPSVAKAQELIADLPPVAENKTLLDGPGVTRGEYFATGGQIPADLFELPVTPVSTSRAITKPQQDGLFELTGMSLSTAEATVDRNGQFGLALV